MYLRRSLRRLWTKKGGFVRSLVIAFLAAVIYQCLCLTTIRPALENWILDLWSVRVRGPVVPPAELVIVGVDDESLSRANLPPAALSPRSWFVDLIQRLVAERARGLLLDFSLSSVHEANMDRELAAAIRSFPTVIGSIVSKVSETKGGKKSYKRKHIVPLEVFSAAAKTVVLLNAPIDRNGETRHFRSDQDPSWEIEQMPQAAILKSMGWNGELPGPNDMVNFYGPTGTIAMVPFFRLWDREDPVPDGFFRDKIVFAGRLTNFPSRQDVAETPYGELFGVEMHATVASNLLQKIWIRRLDIVTESAIVTVAVFVFALLICLLPPLPALFVLLIVDIAWCIISFYAFKYCYFFPGAMLVLFNLPVAYVSSLLQYYWFARRAKEEMENVMGLGFVRKQQLKSNRSFRSGL